MTKTDKLIYPFKPHHIQEFKRFLRQIDPKLLQTYPALLDARELLKTVELSQLPAILRDKK